MKVRQRARQAARTHCKLSETACLLRSPSNAAHLEHPIARLRLGGLAGAFEVPDAATFNSLGREEIERMFDGDAT